MSLIHRIFGNSDGLICGRCERSLEGHDDAACARRMSRRFFFGVCAGAAAVATVVPRLTPVQIATGGRLGKVPASAITVSNPVGLSLSPGDRISIDFGGNAASPVYHIVRAKPEHSEQEHLIHLEEGGQFIAPRSYRIMSVKTVAGEALGFHDPQNREALEKLLCDTRIPFSEVIRDLK